MQFRSVVVAMGLIATVLVLPVHAQKKYGPGVTDTEIKLGQTVAYSGPGSSFSMVGRMFVGYAKMINEKGGINGRKLNILSQDDAFSPPKTFEVTRQLVEGEGVLAMAGSMGTASQTAVQKYLNTKKVPQLFIFASGPNLHDSKSFPWTVPFVFAYSIEGEVYGRYLRESKPDAKIAVLYQNDDLGKTLLQGLKKGLGSRSGQIVKESSYEGTDPTIDSQILGLQASGADTLVTFTMNKFQAQAIRRVDTIGWKPTFIMNYGSSSIGGTLTNAGLDRSKGLITSVWFKTPSDPTWADDKGMKDYLAFMKTYLPNDDAGDTTSVYAYMAAQLLTMVLERCGDELTRENLLKQTVSLKDVELSMLLPGMKVSIQPDEYYPVRQARLGKFDGTRWVPFTELVSADLSKK